MALEQTVPLQTFQPEDPNVATLRAAQASDALAMARQRIQSAQDNAAVQAAMQQSGGDPDAAIKALQATNPRAAYGFSALVTKQRQDNLKLGVDQADFLSKQTESAYRLFQGINGDPAQLKIALRGAAAMLHDTPAGEQIAAIQVPDDATPDQVRDISDMLSAKALSAKDYHEQIAQGLKAWLGGDPTAGLVRMLSATSDPQDRAQIIAHAKTQGAPSDLLAAAMSLSNQVAAGADPKTTFAKLLPDQKPIEVPQGGTLIDPVTHQPIYESGGKGEQKDYLVNGVPTVGIFDPAKRTVTDLKGNDITATAKPMPPAAVLAAGSTSTDAHDIAQAIANGEQPPVTTGLYRNAGPVRAELARMGFDLSNANEDWTATQKYLGTLNGVQQTRLRQAVSFANSSLDLVDSLAQQWNGSTVKPLNAANLALAKQGLLGQQAKSLAVRLDAQIADLQSELGTVYKGGNSSTDESLALAAKNLQADWDAKTLKDATQQIRTNLGIRMNSLKLGGVAGVGGDNRYAPDTGQGQTAATPNPMTPHAQPVPKNPVKGQIWQSPTGPVTWNGSRWVSGG